jgi:hypothetical protein
MKLYFSLLLICLLTACKSTEQQSTVAPTLTSLLNHTLFELQQVPSEQVIFQLPNDEAKIFLSYVENQRQVILAIMAIPSQQSKPSSYLMVTV